MNFSSSARIFRAHPAGKLEARGLKRHVKVVFGADPLRQHVELQGADHADDPVAADQRLEQRVDAFLGQLLQRAAQMLRLHRVLETHAAQDLGREIGDAG